MYVYSELRHRVFTEDGQVMFLNVRDRAQELLSKHGQATLEQLMDVPGSGSNWDRMACVDRLVELGELRLIARGAAAQFNTYRGKWSPPRP